MMTRHEDATRPKTANDRMAAHKKNDTLLKCVIEEATKASLTVVIFRTSTSNHDGHWRYVASDGKPYSIRDKRVVEWTQARYSKQWLPSICGESAALSELLDSLIGRQKGAVA